VGDVHVLVHGAPREDQNKCECDAGQHRPDDLDGPAAILGAAAIGRQWCGDDGMQDGDMADGAAGGREPKHHIGEPKRHVEAGDS
jgi:hypothetical protein